MQLIKIRILAIFVVLAMVLSGFAVVLEETGHAMNNLNTLNSPASTQNGKIGQYPDGNNAQAGAYDPFNQELYITNYFSNNVTVVNAFLNVSIANISVGSNPWGISYVPYNHDLYVNNYNSSNISIISSITNTVISNISLPGSPMFSTYDPQDETLYVSGFESTTGIIWVINVTNNSVVSTPSLPFGSAPYGMAFDPYNGYMYVTDNYHNDVLALSPSGAIAAYIPVGQQPYGITLDTANKMLYVSDNDINALIAGYPKEYNVTIINSVTNTVVKNVVPGTSPEGVAYDPINGLVYVANYGSGNISVISPATESIIQSLPAKILTQNGPSALVYDPVLQQVISVNDIATIDTTLNYNTAGGYAAPFLDSPAPNSIAFDPNNHLLYVSDNSGNFVNVYSLNGILVKSIEMPGPVSSVAYGNNTVFAAINTNPGEVVLINPESNAVLKTVILPYAAPDGLAYDIRNNTLFIAFASNNDVGVMSLSTYGIVQNLGVGISPKTLTYSNVTNQVYVGQEDANIHVINASSYVNIYPYGVAGSFPSQVIYDPYTNSIYIANSNNNSMFIINEEKINYKVNEATPFYTVPLGSPQQSIALNPSNGLIYIMQSSTDNITIFNPLLNETVGSINAVSLSGAGLMTYIPGLQILLAADSSGYLEEISPAQTFNVSVRVGNLIPAGNTWNVQIQPSIDSALARVYRSTQLSNQSVFLPLSNGTYDLNISTSYSGVPSIHGFFVVNGSGETLLYDNRQYDVNFTETGIPSGVKWSVAIGGKTYSSFSNITQLKLLPGTYEVNITGSEGYEAYPSSLLVSVSGSNISQNLYFQSPHSQTYGSVSSTVSLYSGASYSGDSYIPVTSSTSSFYSAYDPALGIMFIPVHAGSHAFIQVYSTSDKTLLASDYKPLNQSFSLVSPISAYFDPINSMFYVVDNFYNVLASVFPDNGTIDSMVHLPGELTSLLSGIGDVVYAANATGSVFGVNVNTGVVKNFTVSPDLSNTVMLPYHQNLFMLNNSGSSLIELNTTTGSVSQFIFTSGFVAFQVIAGEPGVLYISGDNAGFVEVFNESTGTVTASVDLVSSLGGRTYSGNIVTGGVYDQINGYMYFSSAATFSQYSYGNFTVYDPESGKVISSFPGLNSSSAISMILNSSNQKIYAVDLSSETITVISPQTYYTVTVTEKGLHAGTTWTLKLSNGEIFTTTGTSITFSAENNTLYSYTLISGNSSFSGTPGTFTLSGAPEAIQASFSLLKYAVDIKETGLPSGTKWFVSINGTMYNSTTDEIVVQLPNGTYSYTVSGMSGYSINNGTGSVSVRGGAITDIKFSNSSLGLPVADIEIIASVILVSTAAGVAMYFLRIRRKK